MKTSLTSLDIVNKNDNILRSRKIEHSEPDDSTNRTDMDVVMEETIVSRALSAQESTSLGLVDLTLLPTEVHMNNWKPIVQNIMQQCADYDNESYDMPS